jgi:hypothetical protein
MTEKKRIKKRANSIENSFFEGVAFAMKPVIN